MTGNWRKLSRIVALGVIVAAAWAVVPALAAEPEAPAPGPVASSWIMWPKPGETQAFEDGLKAHAAWRKAAGEGWTWQVYQPVVGEDLTFYVVRSGGHQWADLDADVEWEKSNHFFEKWMEQAGTHVARYQHFVSVLDPQHSKWQASDDYRYFGVSSLVLRPGGWLDMLAGLDKIHTALVDKKWPMSYSIQWSMGGESPILFIVPFRSYAEMAEPEPSMVQLITEALGSKEAAVAALKQFEGSFEREYYTVYLLRADLSTPK